MDAEQFVNALFTFQQLGLSLQQFTYVTNKSKGEDSCFCVRVQSYAVYCPVLVFSRLSSILNRQSEWYLIYCAFYKCKWETFYWCQIRVLEFTVTAYLWMPLVLRWLINIRLSGEGGGWLLWDWVNGRQVERWRRCGIHLVHARGACYSVTRFAR